ncbi:Na+/H+ antiporter NhaA [Synechococcus sp. PCC 6312]|uniref:Na+/H+ antiporter NhaA n=1 Tax=Synechococcus sp. (strain ATCC 27167 / PCC 6312) TaxID=195253 RepID=UPI00029F2E2F|nr:Na+/H+ antiporter NhaA [Synechococcus sp. PCC 6312]AFY60599.1 sodium/proton antiporter, NhaA family [Synechococcus sp. PCC 6312]
MENVQDKDQQTLLPEPRLPIEPVDRLIEPFSRFLHVESASGIVLLLVTVVALILANSSFSDSYLRFWQTPLSLSVGSWQMNYSLQHWINDGLMAVFFFVIGLEVKREIVLGELKNLRAAIIPLVAALGGMVIPAAFFLLLQWGEAGQRGWGIPMATDIAFVVGCLAILGTRVPKSLRILLLTLAIIDDIGAILVIAIGYTDELHLNALAWGFGGIGLIGLLLQIGVRSLPLYVLLGLGVWFGFHESGVHATIAGVILGLITPAQAWISQGLLAEFVQKLGDVLQGNSGLLGDERQALVESVTVAAQESTSPVERLEAALHPWVGFGIMPVFALANAGIPIQGAGFRESIVMALIVGLAVGKPVGILLFSGLTVLLGWAKLPDDMTWGILGASGILAGIGFTMSLFIAGLALTGDLLDAAKLGILLGSALSAVVGMLLLVWLLPRPGQTSLSNTPLTTSLINNQ